MRPPSRPCLFASRWSAGAMGRLVHGSFAVQRLQVRVTTVAPMRVCAKCSTGVMSVCVHRTVCLMKCVYTVQYA